MSRPDIIPFSSFIQINRAERTPVYLQLVFQFIKAIQMGYLPANTKLPGTRMISLALGINRNTIFKAFQDLELQGWLDIVPNKGIYVLKQSKEFLTTPFSSQFESETLLKIDYKVNPVLNDPEDRSNLKYQFDDGKVYTTLQQSDTLARLFVSSLKNSTEQRNDNNNEITLKKHLANFLNVTRGLRLNSEQILVTTNQHQSLYLAVKVLLSEGDHVLIAGKGYYRSNMVLGSNGAKLFSVPTDEFGIMTNSVKQICESKPVRMVYLSSNFQYPENISLHASRKMELLQLAKIYGFIIIEDDYDYESHYDHRPIPPLKHLDTSDHIIYLGTLSSFLPTGFNVGFVVAHKQLLIEFSNYKKMLDPINDHLKEAVLTSWIEEGEIHRLNKKNRKLYKTRRDYFAALLEQHLSPYIRFSIPSRGLAIWVEWTIPLNLLQLRLICAANGLHLPMTILYQDKTRTGMRLGFASCSESDMKQSILMLKKSVNELLNP